MSRLGFFSIFERHFFKKCEDIFLKVIVKVSSSFTYKTFSFSEKLQEFCIWYYTLKQLAIIFQTIKLPKVDKLRFINYKYLFTLVLT